VTRGSARLALAAAVVCLLVRLAAATEELSGRELYDGACASCHGADGRGAPEGTAISVPLPDFTDCNFITREGNGNWGYLLAHGGKGLGLSLQMPAFADVLTDEQVHRVLDYIRGFCTDPRWPRGELNFRRPLITTKAFPEDELLLLPELTKGRDGVRDWVTEVSFERRVGARGQVEIALPFVVHDVSDGPTTGGVGDLALAYKHVLYADLPSLTIASASLDLVLPSGDRDRHLGDGTVSFEPSLLAGKEIRNVVIQAQILGIAPIDENRADRGVDYRFAFSYPLSRLKRAWVPTLELEVLQNVTAQQHNLSLTPEIYKGITQRGHVAVAVGAQIPVAGGPDPFDYRVLAFLLWEYTDGGLWW
jgi:mono/diheme cytochrome c family protein